MNAYEFWGLLLEVPDPEDRYRVFLEAADFGVLGAATLETPSGAFKRCLWCGEWFRPIRATALYCCEEHNNAYNRAKRRGEKVGGMA